MRRLSLGLRLFLAFMVIFLLMFIGSAVGMWQYHAIGVQSEHLQQVDYHLIRLLRAHNRTLTLYRRLWDEARTQDRVAFTVTAWVLQKTLSVDLPDALQALNQLLDGEASIPLADAAQTDMAQVVSQVVGETISLAEAGQWDTVRLRLAEHRRVIEQTLDALVVQVDRHIEAERQQALEAMRHARDRAMVILVSTGMLTLWMAGYLGYVVTRSILQPLEALNAGAQALAAGDLRYTVPVEGNDELAHLGRAFNYAASQLAELYDHLEEAVQQRTEALRRRTLQLETAVAVGQNITSVLELLPLMEHVVEEIRKRYGYGYVGIFLLDESTQTLVARAGTGDVGQQIIELGTRIPLDRDTLLGHVALSRRTLIVDDVEREDRYRPLPSLPRSGSELGLPLAVGERLLGVLDIRSAQVGRFGDDDLPALQLLADQVAIAIHNAMLYEMEKSRRQLAERLYTIGTALVSTLDLSAVLDMILHHLLELVHYDRGAVMLRTDGTLEIVAALGFPPEVHPTDLQVTIHEGDVYEDIRRSRRPLHIPDVSQRKDWQHVKGVPPARVWLGVPLIRQGEVIGMLSLVRETPLPYTDEEITLSATFANQAAIALHNARLYARANKGIDRA